MSTQLVRAVLKWWEEHQYDTVASDEDEYNVYDEPPKFVRLALASQPAEQPRGEFDKAIHAIDDLAALNGEEHDEAAWKLIRDRIGASQPKAATDEQVGEPVAVIRHYTYSGVARNGESMEAVVLDGAPYLPEGTKLYTHPAPSQTVTTAGGGVTDDPAAHVLRKIAERVEHFRRVGKAGGQYTDGRRHEAQLILDLCTAAIASPSAPRVGVPEGWKLVPVEPTPAMSAAGFCVNEAEHDPAGVYRAMLAAAPESRGV
jgi:hypothetical protein